MPSNTKKEKFKILSSNKLSFPTDNKSSNTQNSRPSLINIIPSISKIKQQKPTHFATHRICSCPVSRQNSSSSSNFSSKWSLSNSEGGKSGNLSLALYVPTDDCKDTGECKAKSCYIDKNKRDLGLYTRLKLHATLYRDSYYESCRILYKKWKATTKQDGSDDGGEDELNECKYTCSKTNKK